MARAFLTKRDIIAQIFSFLLGVVINTSPVYATILLSTVILIYLLVIFARSTMHPETLLMGVLEQVTDTRLWIDDEAAARRAVDMYIISVRGYKSLMRIEARTRTLISQYRKGYATRQAFQYAAALPALVMDARKCQLDIMALRADLEDEVHQLNDCH